MLNFNTIMRKSSFVFFVFILFLSASCSNAGASKLSYTDVDTIKEVVKEREAQVSWTKDIEGELLGQSLAPDAALYEKDIKYTHLLAKINKQKLQPVYPEYPEFALLDTRLLPVKAKESVQNFCQALSEDFYNKPQSYFDNSYIFNLVFFRDEFEKDWKEHFGEDFPITPKKNEGAEVEQSALFTKWLLGEPFIGQEITQVPVRFYCNRGTVDVTLYLNKKTLIYQVSVERWGKI